MVRFTADLPLDNVLITKEELEAIAKTLSGKPITINFDSSKVVGHVDDAWVEEEEDAEGALRSKIVWKGYIDGHLW